MYVENTENRKKNHTENLNDWEKKIREMIVKQIKYSHRKVCSFH